MRQGVRLLGVWLKRLLSMTVLQIVEVGVVEPRQVALDVVEGLQAFGYLVPWGAVGEELPQLGEQGAVCVVHARLVGCDAILLRLAQFRDDHAREQAVEPFRLGEQVAWHQMPMRLPRCLRNAWPWGWPTMILSNSALVSSLR